MVYGTVHETTEKRRISRKKQFGHIVHENKAWHEFPQSMLIIDNSFIVIGECDWTTPCSTGICYANNTGCPVTGVYLPTYGDVDSGQEELPEEEGSENDHTRGIPRHYFTTLLVSSGLLLIVIVLSILITLKR